MATHSSILARRISWTEEPGGLQSMQSQGMNTNEHAHVHPRGQSNPFHTQGLQDGRWVTRIPAPAAGATVISVLWRGNRPLGAKGAK